MSGQRFGAPSKSRKAMVTAYDVAQVSNPKSRERRKVINTSETTASAAKIATNKVEQRAKTNAIKSPNYGKDQTSRKKKVTSSSKGVKKRYRVP